jgi:hypothetical protein
MYFSRLENILWFQPLKRVGKHQQETAGNDTAMTQADSSENQTPKWSKPSAATDTLQSP